MQITENNIEKALQYLDKFTDADYEKLVDKIVEEQAYLSTFIQQNLENIFKDKDEIQEFAFNLYFITLYLYKTKLKDKYKIIEIDDLKKVLSQENKEFDQDELGDFLFTQLTNSFVPKEAIMKIVNLLNIIIHCVNIQ